jgi:quercetin dioxygenase-like cupin family protein
MVMRQFALLCGLLLLAFTAAAQTPAPLPLGAGRPDVEGIKRTQLRDDATVTVTRVHFAPGAAEPPHTHATDVILVPVIAGSVDFTNGAAKVTALKPGEVQFVTKNVTHALKNTGKQPFELIAIAVK